MIDDAMTKWESVGSESAIRNQRGKQGLNTSDASTRLFYASFFEMLPDDNETDVWALIIHDLQDWIIRKEKAYSHRNRDTSNRIASALQWQPGMMTSARSANYLKQPLANLISSSAISKRQNHRKDQSQILLALQKSITTKAFETRNYTQFKTQDSPNNTSIEFALGQFNASDNNREINTAADSNAYPPRYWAMDYWEPDSENWWRYWLTRVGVTRTDSETCFVSVQVRYWIDPSLLQDDIELPNRTVPNFVKTMLNHKNTTCVVGEDPIGTIAIAAQQDTFEMFEYDLTKPIRKAPLITICSDCNGNFEFQPDELASKVAGQAFVYAFDYSQDFTDEKLNEFFDSPIAKKYMPRQSEIRVFFPNVNPSNADDSVRHRFFRDARFQEGLVSIVNDILAGTTRLYKTAEGCVSCCRDVNAYANRARRLQLINDYRSQLKSTKSDSDKALKLLTKQLDEAIGSSENAKQALKQRQNEALQLNAAFKAQQASLRDSEELLDLQEQEIDRLRDERDEAIALLEEIDKENTQIKSENESAKTLSAKLQESKQELERLTIKCAAFASLNRFPEKVDESLHLAEKVFADRIIVLPEAHKSAQEHESGDANEAWEMLYALANVLHPMCFDQNGIRESGSFENAFHNETGFPIAFRETGQTKSSPNFKRLRVRSYNGEKIDITPHIKGKSGKRNEPLRIHFAIHDQSQRIIVGHCGAHLDTAGTRRKGLK